MRSSRIIIALTLLAQASAADAGSVFRCVENGKTSFSETATNPACRPMDIKETVPDPKEMARHQRELEEWSKQRDFEVQNILRREAVSQEAELNARLRALGPAPVLKSGYGAKVRARRRANAAGARAAVVGDAAAPTLAPSRASVGGGK